jgi:hypothetical protein
VVEVRVHDRTLAEDQVVRIPPDQLRGLLEKGVAGHPGFALEPQTAALPGGYRLRLDVEMQGIQGTEKGKASVLLAAELRPVSDAADQPALGTQTLRERVYELDKVMRLQAVYQELTREALGEVLRVLGLEARLRSASPAQILHAIRSGRIDELDEGFTARVDLWLPVSLPGLILLMGDLGLVASVGGLAMTEASPTASATDGADVREMAIKAAALRRLREAVPALLEVLVAEPRVRIQDLCLGALAEIKDPRAVPVLIPFSRKGEPDRLRKVIGVVGQIGGVEARAFLETLADGHEDPDLQKLARETMSQLRLQPGTTIVPRPAPGVPDGGSGAP